MLRCKLTYPDGTVKDANWIPVNFTGTVKWTDGGFSYWVNGFPHRDGGLPARVWATGTTQFLVNGNITGELLFPN
jgi:hypothetical protein